MPASPPFRDTETSTGWEGVKAHPDAPAGGSGPGFSRPSHSHEEKSLWGGVSEFLDAGIHGVESIGDSVYHVAADAVNGATEMEEGCENVFLAVERAKNYAGGAILESTGFELAQLRDGLVEALLFSLAILVLSTSIGAVAGGILVGLVSAGTGTAVGLATGADVGLDIGLAILNWLGIAFLMVYVATHLQVVMSYARRGVSLAWVAGRNPNHEREADIEAAARMLSKAAGEFFGIVLQGIVLYVMHEVGTNVFTRVTSSERYAEVMAGLIEKLKRSRFGEGFANFIERNFPKLLETAAQRRKAETDAGGGGGGGGEGGGGGSGSGGGGSSASAGSQSSAEPAARKPRMPSKTNKNIDQTKTAQNPDGSTTFYDKSGNAVTYNNSGYPDFSPYAEAEVKVDGLKGTIPPDDKLANQAAGLSSTPEGYTWHHVEDGETMQLVPTDIHSTFPHTGGASMIRNQP
jgi:uncharacterized membrane protein YgcG